MTRWSARTSRRHAPPNLGKALLRHLREVAPHGPRDLRSIAISLRLTVAEALRGLEQLEAAGDARRVRDGAGNAIGWEIC